MIDLLFYREIFGPLLPIVPVDDIDAAIKFVNERLDFYFYFYIFLPHLIILILETTPWRFIFSPKTLKSKPKVIIPSSSPGLLSLNAPCDSLQQDAEWSGSCE